MMRSLGIDLARQKTAAAKHKYGARVSAQKSIPIDEIFPEGIFRRGKLYSQTWGFSDVNYSVASPQEQEGIFLKYRAVLNSLPPDAVTKITIMNSRRNMEALRHDVLIAADSDGLDELRGDYNSMILDKSRRGNGIVQSKFITVSADRARLSDARTFFARVGGDVRSSLSELGSHVEELTAQTRLAALRGFLRQDDTGQLAVNLRDLARRGHDFKDVISPDRLEFKSDHFEIGSRFGRVLFLKGYPSFLRDSMIAEMTSASVVLSLSIDVLPVPTDEAVRETQKRIMSVESDITRHQ
ncbi:MAG: TraE family protein, partial [Oscillospiraceae bacterium]|nr:TraE family protein [Oscillospiraceae bacterium]